MTSEGRDKDAWVIDDIGGRAQFEDAHCLLLDFAGDRRKVLGGVFDGHNGKSVAQLAARRSPELFQKLLSEGLPPERAFGRLFAALDKETTGLEAGSVAVGFFMNGRDLTYANVGDCALLLVSRRSERILTEWHRLSNEKERIRIIEAGGRVDGSYVMIPTGHGLQCTRSLGDNDFKECGVISDPFVGSLRLQPDDIWIIAACDGLWDFMRPEEVAATARKMSTARAVAEALHHEAIIERQTSDNLTVMVVDAMV